MYLLALLFGFSCPDEGVSGWPGALLITKSDFILGFENTTQGGEAKHQRVREVEADGVLMEKESR